MGSTAQLRNGQTFLTRVTGTMWPQEATVEWVINGRTAAQGQLPPGPATEAVDLSFEHLAVPGADQFILVKVRDGAGRLVALSNPVFLDVR